jgi:hypothetical protein
MDRILQAGIYRRFALVLAEMDSHDAAVRIEFQQRTVLKVSHVRSFVKANMPCNFSCFACPCMQQKYFYHNVCVRVRQSTVYSQN